MYERWVWDGNRLLHIDPKFLWLLQHFFILLGCSTGVLRAQVLCLALALTTASCPQVLLELELWLQLELKPACLELQLKPSVAAGYIIVLTPTCFLWASTGQGDRYSDIFDRMHLFLDWWLGRRSICYRFP